MPAKAKDNLTYPQFAGLGLNLQQQAFAIAYVRPDVGFNASRAYREAYDVPESTPAVVAAAASRLLHQVNIQKAVSIEIERLAKEQQALAQKMLESWATTAFADWTDVLNIDGPFVTIKHPDEIPPHMRAQIKSIENTANGIKVTFCDKDKAKENIAKALGMFMERSQQVGESYESIIDRLAAAETEKKGE